ncbi:hypothetical protein GCM10010411_75370 [Actinomadura fulvescens]|uniref:Core-binding (CB) domain-containing protein n=1 Tax=Actinomadura fulvescens TaxID=46160 RepID=A0ABN3QIP3_9ACTN
MTDDASPPPPTPAHPTASAPAESSGAELVMAVEGVVVSPAVPAAAAARERVAGGEELSAGAAERIGRALADSTRDTYAAVWEGFLRWCWLTGHTPLPASAEALANYLDYTSRQLTRRGRPPAPATLSKTLGSLQAVHRRLTGQVADVRLANLVLRDYRRQHAKSARAEGRPLRRQSLPITDVEVPILIGALLEEVPAERLPTPRVQRDQCALLLGLTLAGRSSDVAALDIGDVRFSDYGLAVTIPYSKTDQEARGETREIPYGSQPATCPVRTTRAWIETLAQQGITAGPLLRGVDSLGRVAGTARYRGPKAVGPISNQGLNDLLRHAVDLARVRFPDVALEPASCYSWHGLRAGFVVTGGRNNIPPTVLQQFGRWNDLTIMMGYWRSGRGRVGNPIASFRL